MNFKIELAKIIAEKTKTEKEQIQKLIEVPKNLEMGDYALPCFTFTKEYKKPPQQIAQQLSKEIKENWFDTESSGSYLNFRIKKDILATNILAKIQEPYIIENTKSTIIGLESPSPNANKPLHLGHARNMLLGLSLKKIYEKVGNEVIWFDLVNDKGVHICKSMLA